MFQALKPMNNKTNYKCNYIFLYNLYQIGKQGSLTKHKKYENNYKCI